MEKLLAGPAGKLLDDPRVAAAGAALSPNPQLYMLLDPARFIRFGAGMARTAGAATCPVDLPDQPAAFIAAGLYLQPDQIRAELFIPAEPVKLLTKALKALKAAGEGEKE